jgi:hypothetical protein
VAGFSGAEVRVDSNRLKIGVFSKRPPSPLQEGYSVPTFGLGSVNRDSAFSLDIDLSPAESLSVGILLWYDLDDNDTLTPSLEYSCQPQLDTSANPLYLEYRYTTSTSEWLLGASSTVARDMDTVVLFTKYPLKAPLRAWTVKGKLESDSAFSLVYGSPSLVLGAFYSSGGSFPSGPSARPDAGWCRIGTDSGFSLVIKPPKQTALKNAYLNVAAWYDVDRDSLLDTLDEPFAQILLPQRSICRYYYAASQSSPWHWQIDSAAGRYVDFKAVLDTTFSISKSLVSDRHHWTLNGVVKPDSGVTVTYSEKRLFAGVFACTDTLPSLRIDTAFAAGTTRVNTDSTFTLNVDASSVQRQYMVLVAWYDRDSNKTFDSLVDPYSFLMTTGDPRRPFFYKYASQDKEWRALIDNKTAQNRSSLILKSGEDLVPIRNAWTINGKLRPRDTFSMDYATNRVRFGAFPSSGRTFTPSDSNLTAAAGAAVVGADSSFTLKVNAQNTANGYITLCAWFDSDSDKALDASEPWNTPVISTASTAIAQYFFDSRSKLWRFAPDSSLANDASGVAWYVRRNLRP